MYSTAGIIKHAKESPKQQFIIATELETIHKLQADNPTKEFIPIHSKAICGQMKKVTLEKVLEALEKEQYEVRLPEDLRAKAWLPIQRMLDGEPVSLTPTEFSILHVLLSSAGNVVSIEELFHAFRFGTKGIHQEAELRFRLFRSKAQNLKHLGL